MAKRIFIAFAKEDEAARNMLKGQADLTKTPFEYVDMSVKEPYSSEWKEKTRSRIRGSAGVVVLLSKNTLTASGALWEINCAIEEKKPLLGLWIYKEDKSVPDVMKGTKVIRWTWEGLAAFIESV